MNLRRIVAIAALAGTGILMPATAAFANHPQPTTKEDCKNGGFAEYKTSGRPDAVQRFDNQGQCIKFVETGKS